jgi:hypothetical protein
MNTSGGQAGRYLCDRGRVVRYSIKPLDTRQNPLQNVAGEQMAKIDLPLLMNRGRITEITGSRSSGRAALIQVILETTIALGETCAIVDAADSWDAAGLDNILWVRCAGRSDHAIKAADWILHAGGFGVVVLDLCEIPARVLGQIPLSWWYRFRNAIENTRTIFIVVADQHTAGSSAMRIFGLDRARLIWSGSDLDPLLAGIEFTILPKKPPAGAAFCEARLAG